MWKPGDVVLGRGVFNHRVWTAVPVIVVKDTSEEIAMTLLPGTECMTETDYAKGKKDGKRRWDFKYKDWNLAPFLWRTNRTLILLEPNRFYSIRLNWHQDNNQFVGYYVNFQLPFQRSRFGFDTLDLELDIVVQPDFSFEWKDVDDYEKGIEVGIILPEWAKEIENAKPEILGRLEKRHYPFDGSWLDWMPDPSWSPPRLPNDWNQIEERS
jgi:protein associated with RNAse G/E